MPHLDLLLSLTSVCYSLLLSPASSWGVYWQRTIQYVSSLPPVQPHSQRESIFAAPYNNGMSWAQCHTKANNGWSLVQRDSSRRVTSQSWRSFFACRHMAVADWTVLRLKQGCRLRRSEGYYLRQCWLLVQSASSRGFLWNWSVSGRYLCSSTQVSDFAHTNNIFRPSSEANSRSSGQEIPRSLWNSYIITVIAKFRGLSLYLARLIHLTLFHTIPVNLILLLSSHLQVGFHS
jgi:hypothetical protein